MLQLRANHPDPRQATQIAIVRDHGGLVAIFDTMAEFSAFLRERRLTLRTSSPASPVEVVSLDIVEEGEKDCDPDVPV